MAIFERTLACSDRQKVCGTYCTAAMERDRIQPFGLNGDIPTTEDVDGDKITDIGVYRPSTGIWYHYRSGDNTVGIVPFGINRRYTDCRPITMGTRG